MDIDKSFARAVLATGVGIVLLPISAIIAFAVYVYLSAVPVHQPGWTCKYGHCRPDSSAWMGFQLGMTDVAAHENARRLVAKRLLSDFRNYGGYESWFKFSEEKGDKSIVGFYLHEPFWKRHCLISGDKFYLGFYTHKLEDITVDCGDVF